VLLLAPSSLPYPLYLVEGNLLGDEVACEESPRNTQVYTGTTYARVTKSLIETISDINNVSFFLYELAIRN